MEILTVADINQFLPQGKLGITGDMYDPGSSIDVLQLDALEDTAKTIVFSRLRETYDTGDWSTTLNTPGLIKTILALLVAGWVYDRQFSEESADGNSYGSRRVREAYEFLDGIMDDTLNIDAIQIVDVEGTPSTLITDPVFTMGSPF